MASGSRALVIHRTLVAWVPIPAGALKWFELKYLLPYCVNVCMHVTNYICAEMTTCMNVCK